MLVEAVQSPVLAHAGVQEELVDGGQLVAQHGVERLDYGFVALHGRDSFIINRIDIF
ncbi:hypothetical protein D3C71_2221920 [compost metagenome]